MTPDPSLLDHLLTLHAPEDAFDAYLWAQHPWAVRLLLLDKETAYDSEWGGRCRSCDDSWTDESPEIHKADCLYVAALKVLKHWKLAYVVNACERWAELEIAQEELEREERARLVAAAIAKRAGRRSYVGHFADNTTAELLQEESNTDQYGRVNLPPPGDPYWDPY